MNKMMENYDFSPKLFRNISAVKVPLYALILINDSWKQKKNIKYFQNSLYSCHSDDKIVKTHKFGYDCNIKWFCAEGKIMISRFSFIGY